MTRRSQRYAGQAGTATYAAANGAVPDLAALPGLLEAGEGGLLGDVARFISTYVVMEPAQLVAVSLWVVHTHVAHFAEQTPYLVITSPEKQCGKTRLLETLELLVPRSWQVIAPSEAVLYRTVDGSMPTLLLDETDTIFNPTNAKDNEHLRALINAGNRPGVTVPRCVGSSQKVHNFNVYCAKALAGIGTLPDTITDRSISIRLKRRSKSEQVERFRRRQVVPAGHALRDQVAKWGKQNKAELKRVKPKTPDELSDRMLDACEQLFAIAGRMKEPWPALARAALVELCTGERVDSRESMGKRLLDDIKTVFDQREARALRTPVLLEAMHALEEAPWGSYYGRGLNQRDLAALLRPYGVKPATIRFKKAGKQATKKGYRRSDFVDVWNRYATPSHA